MPEVKPTEGESKASIKVVGVGGAGGSAVERMKEVGLAGVEFVAINTDAQALHHSPADVKVHIGKGLGAGGDPEKGREAAEEGREAIDKALDGADMVFMSVSNDHTADFLTVFYEIGKIGNDDVDTKHLIIRE